MQDVNAIKLTAVYGQFRLLNAKANRTARAIGNVSDGIKLKLVTLRR